MSIETALSKFGRLLDSFISKVRKFFGTLFVNNYAGPSSNKPSLTTSAAYSILVFDGFLAFLSIFISIHLRIGMDFLDYSPAYILKNMLVFGLVSSSVFLWLQTYQSFWRYTTIEDMPPIFLSVILSNLLFFPLMMLMNQGDFLPYSVLVINVFVLSTMLMIPRFLTRMLYKQKISKIKRFDVMTRRMEQSIDIPEVILIGSIPSIEAFSREVISNDEVPFNFNPIGILTLDQADIGRTINGIPVLGELYDIEKTIDSINNEGIFPKQLILCEKSIPVNIKKFLTGYSETKGLLLIHVMFHCTFDTIS